MNLVHKYHHKVLKIIKFTELLEPDKTNVKIQCENSHYKNKIASLTEELMHKEVIDSAENIYTVMNKVSRKIFY